MNGRDQTQWLIPVSQWQPQDEQELAFSPVAGTLGQWPSLSAELSYNITLECHLPAFPISLMGKEMSPFSS